METLLEGKDQVLEYFEREAERVAGQKGLYQLMKDDSGNLVLFVAGHSFIGTGIYLMGGKHFAFVNGLVVHAEQDNETSGSRERE